MEPIIPLLTAFGLGSVIAALLQAHFNNLNQTNKRRFEEKKEAYIGLLEAYHRAAVEGTDDAAKHFAYWQMRCELVAPDLVRKAIERIVETNDDPRARSSAHDALKETLRRDLNVEKA